MKQFMILVWFLSSIAGGATVTNLRCEYLPNPIGIDTLKPRLSWQLESTTRADSQVSAQIIVASSQAKIDANIGDMWTTNISSSQSVNIEYDGAQLIAAKRYFWKVNVTGLQGATGWSKSAQFVTGLFSSTDWSAAKWIGMDSSSDAADCPWFRKTFSISQIPDEALVYIGSLGYHELYVNGKKVTDAALAPNVSYLRKRVYYKTYDIHDFLTTGTNVIAVWISAGWANADDLSAGLPKKLIFLGKVSFSAGSPIVTDATWKCSQSNTIHLGGWKNSDFGGDQIDARKNNPNWNMPGYNDAAWKNASTYTLSRILSSDLVPANKICDTIKAVSVTKIGTNKYKVAMARLYTGWIEVALKNGTSGSAVTIMSSSHDGEEVQFNQLDKYIYDESGQGTFCNRFSYHEIKYIVISGINYTPSVADIRGYRISNDFTRTGSFSCSNPLLNKIYEYNLNTIVNLTTGGYVSDCPHRERLGYGEVQMQVIETYLSNYETEAFFTKVVRDWTDVQSSDGSIPNSSPTVGGGGGPAWAGASIAIPYEFYSETGDKRILESALPTMKNYSAFLDTHTDGNGMLQVFGGYWDFLGDWVPPPPTAPESGKDALLFNNCYQLLMYRIVSKTSQILGKTGDAQAYNSKATKLATAINTTYYNASGKYYQDTRQSHQVMPLYSGAVPPANTNDVMKTLEKEIMITKTGHLDVGDPVIYYMTKYLMEADRNDLINAYMTKTDMPSYGYFISRGLDTWPEEWDLSYPYGVSPMHSCYNGMGMWFQQGLAGIRRDSANLGYQKFIIKPAPVSGLTFVNAQTKSTYGTIVSNWTLASGKFTHTISIPANTSATYYFPDSIVTNIKEGTIAATSASGVSYLRKENGYSVFAVKSGNYVFTNGLPVSISRVTVPKQKKSLILRDVSGRKVGLLETNKNGKQILLESKNHIVPGVYNVQ